MVIGLVLLGAPGSASAQEPSRPSPQELWNAYPLDPGTTTLTVEQALPPAEADGARSQAPSGSQDDSGFSAGVAGALAAATFIAGLALGRGRRRKTVTETDTVRAPSPAAPEPRFVRRDFPAPSRPAPPPPPPPPPRERVEGLGGRP